jgi:hypothetical protein
LGHETQETYAGWSKMAPPVAVHEPVPSVQYRYGGEQTLAHVATSSVHLVAWALAGRPHGRNCSELHPASLGATSAPPSTRMDGHASALPASAAASSGP